MDFLFVYGSWGPLDRLKILPRSVGTFRPPGKPLPRTFQKSIFVVYFVLSKKPKKSKPWADLAKQMTSRGRNTYQNVRNVQYIGTDALPFSNEFGRVELSHFPSENVEKHPKSPTYQMWNEYNVFLKNTLLKISVYYI